MRRIGSIVVLVIIGLVSTLVSCTLPFSNDQRMLPDFADKRDGRSVEIDLTKHSRGVAEFDAGSYVVRYRRSGRETDFKFYVVSENAGILTGQSVKQAVDQLSMNISRILTPGDAIADLFIAVKGNEMSDTLSVTAFLDTDWRQEDIGKLFLAVSEFGPDYDGKRVESGWPKEQVVSVDFDQAVDGVWFKEFVFSKSSNPAEWGGSPVIAVTNMQGPYTELRGRMNNLEFEDDDLLIIFTGSVDPPGTN